MTPVEFVDHLKFKNVALTICKEDLNVMYTLHILIFIFIWNYMRKEKDTNKSLFCRTPTIFTKSMNTPSVKRQRQRQGLIMQVNGDAWEWVWDRFWSVTMHSNENYLTLRMTLPLPLMLDARCVYSLNLQTRVSITSLRGISREFS